MRHVIQFDETKVVRGKPKTEVKYWSVMDVLCWLKWISRTPKELVDDGIAEVSKTPTDDIFAKIHTLEHLYEKYYKKFAEKRTYYVRF